jgi:uncharacterized protein (DUF4415 family)
MPKNERDMRSTWIDPDDAPEFEAEHFERAELKIDGRVIRPATGSYTKRGRPKSDSPKQLISLRLDPDVIERFRQTGPGWQSRINEILKAAKA